MLDKLGQQWSKLCEHWPKLNQFWSHLAAGGRKSSPNTLSGEAMSQLPFNGKCGREGFCEKCSSSAGAFVQKLLYMFQRVEILEAWGAYRRHSAIITCA